MSREMDMDTSGASATSDGTVTSVIPEWDLVYVRDAEWAYPVSFSRLRDEGVEFEIGTKLRFALERFRIKALQIGERIVSLQARLAGGELARLFAPGANAAPDLGGQAGPLPRPSGLGYLDPDQVSDPDHISPGDTAMPDAQSYLQLGTLSASIKAFGYLPDVSLWRPGDLLLFSSTGKPDPLDAEIRAYQAAKKYPGEHSQWHHVAVYTGNYQMCESNPGSKSRPAGGVESGTIFPYVGKFRINVRRHFLDSDHSADAAGDTGYRIAIAALHRIGTPYAYDRMATQRLSWLHKFPAPPENPKKLYRRMMCSDLYVHAFSVGHGGGHLVHDAADTCPAELSEDSDHLADVTDLKWIKIRP